MLIYDAVKEFANSFSAVRARFIDNATYTPVNISTESALAPAHRKKMQKLKLKYALHRARKDPEVRIHMQTPSGTLVMKHDGKHLQGKNKEEPNAAFTNLPDPNGDYIFQGKGTFENIQSNRGVTETQFAQNLKEAMTAGAKMFPSQDYSNEFAVQFERPRVGFSADVHAMDDAPIPEVPMYNMGWSQMVIKINVPPVLLPGGADPNLNWPISYIRNCAIDWVQEPRMRFFCNNMVRYVAAPVIWIGSATRISWRDMINRVPFFGGMDIKSMSWRRYEWISPNIMPLVRQKPTDEGYQASMETWYKCCDTINGIMQHVPVQASVTVDQQDTYQYEYRYLGATDPVDYTSTNAVYSGLTDYLYKDTAIPWMKMTHYAPSGLSQYQNPIQQPYGENVINDEAHFGQYGFNYAANANPEVLFEQKFTEEVPVKGLDFSRGGKMGVPSIFIPNPIATKTELQTLFDTPNQEKDTQPFYYYCVIVQCIPFACTSYLGMFDVQAAQKLVTTLPFNVMMDSDCEMRFTVTGNYMQFNNAAWNKLYSNMLSPAQIQSVPRLTLSQGGGYSTMQLSGLSTGTPSVALQWWSHYFNTGDNPQMTAPAAGDSKALRKKVEKHPQLNVSREQFQHLQSLNVTAGEDDEGVDCPCEDFLESLHQRRLQPKGRNTYQTNYLHAVPLSIGGHEPFSLSTSDDIGKDVLKVLHGLIKRDYENVPKIIPIDGRPYSSEMTSRLEYRRF